MTRSFSNRLFGGVCGGLAAALPLNAWLWRLIFIGLTLATSGVGALVYLLLWWLAPLESPLRREGNALGGFIGLLLGIGLVGLWFGREALEIDSLYWSFAFLVLAAVFLFKQIFTGAWENIALGLVALAVPIGFLLQAMDILQAGFADIIFRSYPAVLIFLGLSIALRYRMRFGSWLALLLSIVLVAGLASFAYSSRVDAIREDNQISISIPNQADNDFPEISEAVSTMLIEVNTLDTDVNITVANTNQRQIRGNFVGSNNSEIHIAYGEDGQVASMVLRERQASEFPRLEDIGRGRLNLEIPSDIAVGLRLTSATGDVLLDMSALELEQLIFTVGTGNVLVRLPSYQPLSPSVQESNGIWTVANGSLRVTTPDDLGLRFSLSRANNPEPRPDTFDELAFQVLLESSDYVLASRQFESADFKMRFRVDVSGGSFSISNDE